MRAEMHYTLGDIRAEAADRDGFTTLDFAQGDNRLFVLFLPADMSAVATMMAEAFNAFAKPTPSQRVAQEPLIDGYALPDDHSGFIAGGGGGAWQVDGGATGGIGGTRKPGDHID